MVAHGAAAEPRTPGRAELPPPPRRGEPMTAPVRVEVFGRTDVGMARDHNEDSFLVADLSRRVASLQPEVREHEVGQRGSLFVVADGMGGAAAGEIASDMATETIYNHMIDSWGNDPELTEQRFAYRL